MVLGIVDYIAYGLYGHLLYRYLQHVYPPKSTLYYRTSLLVMFLSYVVVYVTIVADYYASG